MTHYTSFPGFCASSSRTAPFWRGPRPRTRHRPDPPRSPALAGSRDRSASTTRDGRDAAPGGRRRSGEVCPRIRKFYLSFAASDATPQTSSPRTNPVARCRIVSGSHSRDVSTTAHPKNPTPNKRYFFRTGRDGQRRVPPGRTPLPGGSPAVPAIRKRCRLQRKKTRVSPFPAGEDVSGPETADRAPPGRVLIPSGTAHAHPCRSGTFRAAGERGQSLRPPVHLLSSLDIETKFRLSASFFQQKENHARSSARRA